jgi:hypothetical protein
LAVADHRIDRGLPHLLGHGVDPLGIENDPGTVRLRHLIDGSQERTDDIGVASVPVDRVRQRDAA